tara:strand:+ start:4295 stop:5299 length:1005 start_codon:yes stop_codon:yes gene_type:complete
MSKIIDVTDIDIFYISFDEPNMEENWADLKSKCPWAKRVHGVLGSDAAHKECARQSETDRFISVDGDNIVDPKFFDQVIDFSEADVNLEKSVISWCGKNNINGLVYGNGGLKCWPVQYVLDMKTHEIAEEERSKVDFCWDLNYIQFNEAFSHVMNNDTPYQAYRAGFREGVKMSLDRGIKVDPDNFEKSLHDKNYHRLLVWCNIGRDIENGLWAMYGTRLGCYLTNLDPSFDFVNVADFKWHTEYWTNEIMPKFASADDYDEYDIKTKYRWNREALEKETERLGVELNKKLNIPVSEFNAEGSKFFKKVYWNPPRMGNLVTEKDSEGRIKYKTI